jgi:dTMP kinase
MSKPLFISFEGGEGGGKTTQAKLLADWMKERGISCVLTKEPGTPYIEECKAIRELLLNPTSNLSDTAELLLFLADRAQHVSQLITPSLGDGSHVICDRYADSTRVYQCARGFGRDKIDMLLDFATSRVMPDLTFILDIPVEIGLERAKAKSIYKDGDRLENAGLKFHEDVRHGFLKLAESIGERRFHIIDVASRTVEQTHEKIVEIVSKKIWVNGLEKQDG